MEEKKKSKFFEKIILWFVIWSAVIWAVWAWLNSEKGKNLKEEISKRLKETSDKINSICCNEKEEKKGFWHYLNKMFFKK